ncbi:MAG: class I SAM-dependent methyltransferase, partial [Sphingomonadales bacterium]
MVSLAVAVSAFAFSFNGARAENSDPASPTVSAAENTVAATGGDAMAKLFSFANGYHRSENNRARNKYRHPVETLLWFGLRENMTVVEISPGGGAWYTEILAPFLKDKGVYYAAGYALDSKGAYQSRNARRLREKLKANTMLYGKVIHSEFDQGKYDIAPEGSADMVLTFRNVHNWVARDYADAAFASFFRALKPGGILGLVEHRGDPDVEQDPKVRSGYVRQDVVIALAEAAGFKLVGGSEINANPKDTKDYAHGVWSLPPSLRSVIPNADILPKDKYIEIGESDRMTLKFIKP